uniref:TsaA-like domain-containing protein n=1 Tax=Strigamia maritima TaxID=126957 RepID=T1J9I1_STRMM
MADVVEKFIFKPVGFIESWFKTKNGTPRQSTICSSCRGTLTISKSLFNNPEHSLDSLKDFSHVWLIFIFHKNSPFHSEKSKVSPPRLNGIRVGVFSTRSPHRPNPIGLTLAKVDKIEGATLHLSNIDLLDGTPVLDIKPYIPTYDEATNKQEGDNPSEICVPSWISNTAIGNELKIRFTPSAHLQLTQLVTSRNCLKYLTNLSEVESTITQLLSADPRSVYRRENCKDRLYYLTVDEIHITCWFDDEEKIVEVLKVKKYEPRN